jgi:hypothetical protein
MVTEWEGPLFLTWSTVQPRQWQASLIRKLWKLV